MITGYWDIAAAVRNKDTANALRLQRRVTVGGPEGLAKIIREETVLYAKIIKAAGIEPGDVAAPQPAIIGDAGQGSQTDHGKAKPFHLSCAS